MRINGTGSAFLNIRQTDNKLKKTLEQLASGKRINSAKDDPASSALVSGLQNKVRGLNQANRNISYGSGALQAASGALSQQSEQLQRLRELAVQASNGALSDSDRRNLQEEFDQGVQQIDSIARNTSFGNTKLLDGSFSADIQSGTEKGQTSSVAIGSSTANALGINTAGISTQDSAQNALDKIDSALSQINSLQASIGAQENALEFRQNANAVQAENALAAQSEAGDADYAQAAAELQKLSILKEAQISTEKVKQTSQQSLVKKLLGD